MICTNLTGMEVQKISREIPRCCFVNIGFPVAGEGLIHWHAGANFAGKHYETGGQTLPSSTVQGERNAKVQVRKRTCVNAPEITGNSFTEVTDYDFQVWKSAVAYSQLEFLFIGAMILTRRRHLHKDQRYDLTT